MKRKAISIVVGLIIASVFLFHVIQPGAFNLIPYSLHEYMWSAGMRESYFIKIFDCISAIVLFWIVYILMKRILKNII